MTDDDMKSLGEYVYDLAQDLGLKDWDFSVHEGGVGEANAVASIDCVYGRRIGNIHVADDFVRQPPEEQRRVLLHELLHSHFDAELTLMERTLPSVMGRPGFDAFYEGVRLVNESAIDAVAAAIAPFYPLWEG